MEKYLQLLKEKVAENKETLIKAGFAAAGAVVGSVVTVLVMNAMNDAYLEEELTLSIEEEVEQE